MTVDGLVSIPVFRGTEPQPPGTNEELEALLDQSRKRTMSHLALATSDDLSVLQFRHPCYGLLSFYEWILFIAIHQDGHVEQIPRGLAFSS